MTTIPQQETHELAVLGALYILARHTDNVIEREAWQWAWDDTCNSDNKHLRSTALELAKEIL